MKMVPITRPGFIIILDSEAYHERGLLTFGLGVIMIMPDVFRSYEYCCGDGGCGSAVVQCRIRHYSLRRRLL